MSFILSEKEIDKAFKLIGLSSEQKRKVFEQLAIEEQEEEKEKSHLFIKAGISTLIEELDTQNARLE